MSAVTRRRFDFATEMRAFAAQVDGLELASRTDPEAPIIAKADLARAMRARAAEVMRTDEPSLEGVFCTGRGRSAAGRSFRAEKRPARRAA